MYPELCCANSVEVEQLCIGAKYDVEIGVVRSGLAQLRQLQERVE
jgi:hypothetical protein